MGNLPLSSIFGEFLDYFDRPCGKVRILHILKGVRLNDLRLNAVHYPVTEGSQIASGAA